MSEPWSPHEYQKKAVKFCVSQGAAGLFLSPGLGKTSISFATFKVLRDKGLVRRALVIAPLRPATSVWPNEQVRWDDFHDIPVRVLHGPQKAALLESGEVAGGIDVINYEGLGWLFQAVAKQDWPWQMLIVDESTRLKHANTLRFKLLRPHIAKFNRRIILTGTPAPNGLLDLFGQVYVLDQGAALGRFMTHFRMSYFDSAGYGGYTWVPRPDTEERIYKKLRPLVLRMEAKDYLKLPPLVNNTIKVTLPPEARRVYEQMEALLIAELEGKTMTAANAAAATGKCRQIANGGAYIGTPEGEVPKPGPKEWKNIHDVKTEAVQELVEELSGQPALIAYEFQHDLARLQAAFPESEYLGGGVTPKKQREVEAAWNGGRLQVLLAQPQSVAHGLNLQGVGAAVIFYGIPWDLESYEQLVRRVWRQGQKSRVVVHHIVAEDTVDEAVMGALKKKGKVQNRLLDALKSHLKSKR